MREPRRFEFHKARRRRQPLTIGIFGTWGAGKTWSALELAKGIASVYGGPIAMVDSEGGRGEHYADYFDYRVTQLTEPFGSLDYLDAVREAQKINPAVVIIDQLSHEHDGPGGLLDYHEQELWRLAKDDDGKRERMKMLAWQKPKAARRALLGHLMRSAGNLILTFRAEESTRPVRKPVLDDRGQPKLDGQGRPISRMEVVPMGFMPIAGPPFVFMCDLCFMLPPAARGMAVWNPENVGERRMVKLPRQFERLAERNAPIDEALGRRLAEWAKGDAGDAPAGSVRGNDREGRHVAAGASAARSVQASAPAPRDRAPAGSSPPAPTSAVGNQDDGEPCWEPMGDSRCGLASGHAGDHVTEEDCF